MIMNMSVYVIWFYTISFFLWFVYEWTGMRFMICKLHIWIDMSFINYYFAHDNIF
jgi:hypothetical protein